MTRQRADLTPSAERLLGDLRLVADAITATCYLTRAGRGGADREALAKRRASALVVRLLIEQRGVSSNSRPCALPKLPHSLTFFTGPLEFPDVFRLGRI